MNRRLMFAIVAGLTIAIAAGAVHADSWAWDGKVRVGGIWLDQSGDESTMPETYNIFDGFTLSSIYIKGKSGPLTHLTLDLSDINQDNRRGVFDFRRTGIFHFRSRFTENHWLFDPVGNIDAGRRNWDNKLSWTPRKYLRFSADYNLQSRDGSRLGLNPGFEGWLGTKNDSKYHRYRLEGQANASNGIGGMVAYDGVMQRDALDPSHERDGYVLSANVHVPGYYVKTLTHVIQGAFGRNEIRESGLGFDLMSLQYTAVWQALNWMRWRYRFYGSQVDDEVTTIRTNNYLHDLGGTFSYKVAVVTLEYGWVALDDDLAKTTTNEFRGSLLLRDPNNKITGRFAFHGRNRDDAENTTLLRDSESQRWDFRVDARPINAFAFGIRAGNRERKYSDINVISWGTTSSAYAAWREPTKIAEIPVSITEVGVEFTYTDDDYDNLWGSEHVISNAVTGRLGLTLFDHLNLMSSFTYLDMDRDLDLEKSIISVGAAYRFKNGLLADIKYNVYNYDDYVLYDRNYTANVVWFNVGYEFSTK